MLIIADNSSINETQEDGYKSIFSFNLNMQLLLLQTLLTIDNYETKNYDV